MKDAPLQVEKLEQESARLLIRRIEKTVRITLKVRA
jgi:hypothetical protein